MVSCFSVELDALRCAFQTMSSEEREPKLDGRRGEKGLGVRLGSVRERWDVGGMTVSLVSVIIIVRMTNYGSVEMS
jgi:hypothetical protein